MRRSVVVWARTASTRSGRSAKSGALDQVEEVMSHARLVLGFFGGSLLGGLAGQVLLDLALPRLDCLGGVDLELEASRCLRVDVSDVDVELLVPATELVDRAVLLAEQGVLDLGLVLPDLDVLLEAHRDALGELAGELAGGLLVQALRLLDADAVHQHEGVLGDGVVAVDQDALDLVTAVVVVQPVDHEGRAEVRGLGVQHRLAVLGAHGTDVRPAVVLQVLAGDMALEDVLEVLRESEVNVEEVRHVDDVVHDLAAVRALDLEAVPLPVGPVVGQDLREFRDRDVLRRRVALGVVPDEQHSVALQRRPRTGAGERRNTPGVGDVGALAVAAPAPVMEGARDGVALDAALAQVAAHVPAVRVENLELALAVGEDDELGAERFDTVRLAVEELSLEADAVPTTRKPRGGGSHVDLANLAACGSAARLRHLWPHIPSMAVARTRYRSWSTFATQFEELFLSRARDQGIVPALDTDGNLF
ncbi:conserved hypothetical protein [Rhodococcus sp. RD6.2]|nr:conserved hypothetical protein [Rhodococcus sp. RD6.2]